MVPHPVLLAEGLYQGVYLPEVVARNLRKEVVIHLIVKPAAEEVDERGARDVTRGGDLSACCIRFSRGNG